MISGMMVLLPDDLLLPFAILLRVQLGCQAADVVGEGVGGGLVHRGVAQLTSCTRRLRLNELALDDQHPRWRLYTTKQCCPM